MGENPISVGFRRLNFEKIKIYKDSTILSLRSQQT